MNRSLALAVTGIAIPRIFFEFAVVSNIALMSEQSPAHRGKIMSMSMAFGLIGGTIASATGPWIYYTWGVTGLGLTSFVALLPVLLILLFAVKERPGGVPASQPA
jgi:MFS family permease